HRSISKRRRMPHRHSSCSDLPGCLQRLRCDSPLWDRQSGIEIGFPPHRQAAVRFPPPRTQGPGSERNNIFGCDLEPRKNLRPSKISYAPEVTKRIPQKVAAPDHSPSSQSLLISWALRCFIVLDWGANKVPLIDPATVSLGSTQRGCFILPCR